jgi:hypothetical protein
MRRDLLFRVWAPTGGAWSLWVRPVLFAQMAPFVDATPDEMVPWLSQDVSWAPNQSDRAVLVIDLRGQESLCVGLVLAGRGYRPVPLYNVCTGPDEVIIMDGIINRLIKGTHYLESLALPLDAPPTFLLDARRMSPSDPVRPGSFDNRWKVFPQDFPSARLLADRGFERVLLIQRGRGQPQEDLAHVLRRWQEAGLVIECLDRDSPGPPVRLTVEQPPWYREIWYRLQAVLGLRRGTAGGFGGIVPRPSHG